MSGEKERVDAYLHTIGRLEPEIAMIDASTFYASAAISLKRMADLLVEEVLVAKRIADALERLAPLGKAVVSPPEGRPWINVSV